MLYPGSAFSPGLWQGSVCLYCMRSVLYLNCCSSFLFTILIKPETQLLQKTKAILHLTLAHCVKTHLSGYIFLVFCNCSKQNWIMQYTALLFSRPKKKKYDHKTSLLFLSPVNTEVWSNTREAVTAEPSALRSGLQQICMFLTASEFFFVPYSHRWIKAHLLFQSIP